MAKHKKKNGQAFKENEFSKNEYSKNDSVSLQDQLNSDVLAKLKLAKKSLVEEEQAIEAERQAQLVFDRKQREKNMSFEELLEKYGDSGSKF